MTRPLRILLLLGGLALSGCAAAAAAGAVQGIRYTYGNIAYQTFTATETAVHDAAVKALDRMQIKVTKERSGAAHAAGRDKIIEAKVEDWSVDIEVKPLSPNATEVRVNAKKDIIIKNKALAAEILNQTSIALGRRYSRRPE